MKLDGGSKRIYNTLLDGWHIHINHRKKFAYLTKGDEFRRVRYRRAVKALRARGAELRRIEHPATKGMWAP